MRETAFTKLFGLRYPIMQSPMGSVSSPELVAAVSNAGGMGMLAVAGLPPEILHAQIERTRQPTAARAQSERLTLLCTKGTDFSTRHPATAGIQIRAYTPASMPAFAGMTDRTDG